MQALLFCNCLNSNQRWLPIYRENQEVPEETNRIWVYHITGRRLSGAVKWPNLFQQTINTGQDAGPKIDSKRNICVCLAIPFWSLNIPLELHVRIRPTLLHFDLSSQCFPEGITPKCVWQMSQSRREDETGFLQVSHQTDSNRYFSINLLNSLLDPEKA